MAATIGHWPGQVRLIPVLRWCQFPPGSTSPIGDLIVRTIVGVLGLAFVFLPYIPGLRTLPQRLGVYDPIWRRHYADLRSPMQSVTADTTRSTASIG